MNDDFEAMRATAKEHAESLVDHAYDAMAESVEFQVTRSLPDGTIEEWIVRTEKVA